MNRPLAAIGVALALGALPLLAGDDAATLYNAACESALAKDTDRAFARLDAALARGFAGCTHLSKDPDLVSLHEDPRWPARLARCEEARTRMERFWEGPTWKVPYAESLSEADRLAGLSRVWSEAKFSFANFALVPDLDWDAEYRAAIPKVLAARSTAAYYRVLEELVAKLRDGHTSVALPKELRPLAQSWPALSTRVAGGRVLVREVLDPALAGTGIRPGLEIVAVEGVPVRAWVEQHVKPAVAASTPQDLEVRTFEARLLDGPAGALVRLTLADEEGRTFTRAAARLAPADRAKLRPVLPLVTLSPIPGGLVHVTIRSFNEAQVVPEFEKLLPRIAASRGVVLDLRENGGGSSANGDAILASITSGSFPTQTWWTREYLPAMRAWGTAEGRLAKSDTRQGTAPAGGVVPAVLLVGPRTYSAAEDFTAAFHDARRGTIVGEPTGGSTGQPLRFALPGGGSAQVCAKRNTLADGTEYVGVGIAPDVVVTTSFEDARAGRDPVLAKAVELLSR